MATQDSKLIADKRCNQLKKTVLLRNEIVIGASGAVTSQTAYKDGGIVAAKAAQAGRYTLSINPGYGKIHRRGANLTIGDTAAATLADGNEIVWRDNDIGEGAKDGTIEVQLLRSDTMADANATSGSKLEVWLEVECGL